MKYVIATIVALLAFELWTSLYLGQAASVNAFGLTVLLVLAFSYSPFGRWIHMANRSDSRWKCVSDSFPAFSLRACGACTLFAGMGFLMKDPETTTVCAALGGILLLLSSLARIYGTK